MNSSKVSHQLDPKSPNAVRLRAICTAHVQCVMNQRHQEHAGSVYVIRGVLGRDFRLLLCMMAIIAAHGCFCEMDNEGCSVGENGSCYETYSACKVGLECCLAIDSDYYYLPVCKPSSKCRMNIAEGDACGYASTCQDGLLCSTTPDFLPGVGICLSAGVPDGATSDLRKPDLQLDIETETDLRPGDSELHDESMSADGLSDSQATSDVTDE